MSSLKYAIVEDETNTSTAEARATAGPAGPVLVANAGNRPDNRITRRVEAALDVDFANGSMPA